MVLGLSTLGRVFSLEFMSLKKLSKILVVSTIISWFQMKMKQRKEFDGNRNSRLGLERQDFYYDIFL